nr:hypothetical protein [Maritalea mobilis]
MHLIAHQYADNADHKPINPDMVPIDLAPIEDKLTVVFKISTWMPKFSPTLFGRSLFVDRVQAITGEKPISLARRAAIRPKQLNRKELVRIRLKLINNILKFLVNEIGTCDIHIC